MSSSSYCQPLSPTSAWNSFARRKSRHHPDLDLLESHLDSLDLHRIRLCETQTRDFSTHNTSLIHFQIFRASQKKEIINYKSTEENWVCEGKKFIKLFFMF